MVKIKNKCVRVTWPKQKTRTRENNYQSTKGANIVVVASIHTSYRIIASNNNALPDKSHGLIHSYSRRITHERVVGAFFVCWLYDG